MFSAGIFREQDEYSEFEDSEEEMEDEAEDATEYQGTGSPELPGAIQPTEQNLENDISDEASDPLMAVLYRTEQPQDLSRLLMAHSPIIQTLQLSVTGLGFSKGDVERLAALRMSRSDMLQRIIELWENLQWPELAIRDVVMSYPQLLMKKPSHIIKSLETLERNWGRKRSVAVVAKGSQILSGNVERLVKAELTIKEILEERLGVELRGFESALGRAVYSLTPDRVRKKLDALLEFLPKGCLQKMFTRTGSTWFKQGVSKIENIYGILVLEILMPALGDGAENAAHIVLSNEPNVLNMNPEVLLTRYDFLSNGFFREAAADIIISRPRFLMEPPKTLLERWRNLLLWANTNPVWIQQLKGMRPEGVATALTYGPKVVARLHYLALFSQNLTSGVVQILQIPHATFRRAHPSFESWYEFMHGPPTAEPPREEWASFERSLKAQWRNFGPMAVRPRRMFVPNLQRDPTGKSCSQVLNLLTQYLTSKQNLGNLVARNHWVLFQDFARVTHKIKWLRGIGLSEADIGTMLKRFPHLLRCCLGDEVAETKLTFLKEVMGRSLREVVHFPNYWGMSMENRLRPRYNFVKKYSDLKLPIGEIFGRTDQVLCRRLKQPLEVFHTFMLESGVARK